MTTKQEKWLTRLTRLVLVLLVLWLVSVLIIPAPTINKPYSSVLESSNGELLGAHIAKDGQWRFPPGDSIPFKFEQCLLTFEDKYFYKHPGINPISIATAVKANLISGRRVKGGSTLTMQVARMWGGNPKRTYTRKIYELFIALHLEANLSKEEILKLYASNAPFGGNVVGLEAAAWRYFGRSPENLSWAESALLAVLPNAPSLMFPGKNKDKLRAKRDRLLDRLREAGIINSETCTLSKLEEVPKRPLRLPNVANHAMRYATSETQKLHNKSTLNFNYQRRAQELVNQHVQQQSGNQIYNAAAVIIEVKTGKILSYIGNANYTTKHGNSVDVVKAPRSTGSVLKPFLYCKALDEGEILPSTLLADVPTYYSGYTPKNYFLNYDGAVHADEALTRSLNVPFVRVLEKHGVDRFYNTLKKLKMTSLIYPSNRYGLSLVLGGAEGKLIDMTGMYASMARVLNRFNYDGTYSNTDYFTPSLVDSQGKPKLTESPYLKAGAIYKTFDVLQEVKRPVSEQGWKLFGSSRRVAWKTGTSFGNRDAWAIGTTPEYVVGVWVGNADGEGRSGLTGVSSAAPLMFELFKMLPSTSWFKKPYDDLQTEAVCRMSGCLAGENCEVVDSLDIPVANHRNLKCKYHKLVHISNNNLWQVNMDCSNETGIQHKKWFVLPPVMEWYYKQKSPLYKTLPPFHPKCNVTDKRMMSIAYPKNATKIFIPKELSGKKGRVIFEVVHRTPGVKVYWHLDDKYLNHTEDFHKLEVLAEKGKHRITIIDQNGFEIVKDFEVVDEP